MTELALNPTAIQVRKLAAAAGIEFNETFTDQWAVAITCLSGDEVKSDATDDLLVALARAGHLAPTEMVRLTLAHHRERRTP